MNYLGWTIVGMFVFVLVMMFGSDALFDWLYGEEDEL